jgi:hypothetical protein
MHSGFREVIENMSTTTRDTTEAISTSGVTVPDTRLAREATELVRDTESPLLFNHSTRVYYFGSLAGKKPPDSGFEHPKTFHASPTYC